MQASAGAPKQVTNLAAAAKVGDATGTIAVVTWSAVDEDGKASTDPTAPLLFIRKNVERPPGGTAPHGDVVRSASIRDRLRTGTRSGPAPGLTHGRGRVKPSPPALFP